MKKLSELKGFKTLSKKEQNKINGSARFYCRGRNTCCTNIPGFGEICEPCRCFDNGGYILL